MAAASTVNAAFACKGSDYGGGGSGGGGGGGGPRWRSYHSRARFAPATTALSMGAPWSQFMERPLGADIPSARRRRHRWERWGWWGWWDIGKRSWSLARAVVCVVMGAIGKGFPTKNLFMEASFSGRCHHITLHGNSFLPAPT